MNVSSLVDAGTDAPQRAGHGAPPVVVVDPIKGGADLREALERDAVPLVSVYTLERAKLAELGVDLDHPGRHIFSSDPHEVLLLLRARYGSIRAVIPASEPSTAFAAALARLLGLPSNHDPHPDRFRNKETMRRHARATGVRVPAFQAVERDAPFEMPGAGTFILKPLRAAGSDAVRLVADADHARRHMREHARDLFGHENTRWLLEQYITGPEFAINTVTSGGRHQAIDVWEYCQPGDGASRAYDNPYWNVLQAPRDARWQALASLAASVLDAFEVRLGFCHLEVKQDLRTGEWHLIEIASRLPGAGMPWMWQTVWGLDVYRDLAALYGGAALPVERWLPPSDSALLGIVFIRNDRAGTVRSVRGLDAVTALDGFVRVAACALPGERVETTDSLQNPIAKIMIKAPDRPTLEATAARVRSLLEISVEP
jgi:biotin carboxylase